MLLQSDEPVFPTKAASVAQEKRIYFELADNVFSADRPYGRDENPSDRA
jgi:hypothetical protein